jgi:hypothetical protein
VEGDLFHHLDGLRIDGFVGISGVVYGGVLAVACWEEGGKRMRIPSELEGVMLLGFVRVSRSDLYQRVEVEMVFQRMQYL